MDEFGLKDTRLLWGHSYRKLGWADYQKNAIFLNKDYIYLTKDDAEIEDTVRHEISHVLSVKRYGYLEGRGHGDRWKQVCYEVGAKPRACSDAACLPAKGQKKISDLRPVFRIIG